MLSGGTSRHASVTDSFDRESFNSAEQTFTVVAVSFMVAHLNRAGVGRQHFKLHRHAAVNDRNLSLETKELLDARAHDRRAFFVVGELCFSAVPHREFFGK